MRLARLLLLLPLLALALGPAPHARAAPDLGVRPVRLVLRSTDAAVLTAADAARITAHVEAALAWWSARGPDRLTLAAVAAESGPWLPGEMDPDPVPTIYAVGDPGTDAYALHRRGWAYIASGLPDEEWPHTVAHELGHLLYDLNDLYLTRDCGRTLDIMCASRTAYDAGTIGCVSLAALGRPCQRTYLPLLEARP